MEKKKVMVMKREERKNVREGGGMLMKNKMYNENKMNNEEKNV